MNYVLGVDLSLTGTGCVILEKDKVVVEKLIKTKPAKNLIQETDRLMEIRDSIPLEFNGERVSLVVIEGLAFMAHFTSALTQLAGLNYMLRARLLDAAIPFVVVAPTTLKKFITGRGNAQKNELMLEVYKRWGVPFANDNLCDSYGLAQIGLAVLNQASNTLTKPQRETIKLISKQLI